MSEYEELKDKIDNFLDKKDLDINDKYFLCKSMMEEYWEIIKDEDIDDDDDEDLIENDDDFDDNSDNNDDDSDDDKKKSKQKPEDNILIEEIDSKTKDSLVEIDKPNKFRKPNFGKNR